MPGIAQNIRRIRPEGAPSQSYVFATDTEPPRYATVDITETGAWTAGPYTLEQLYAEIASMGNGERFLSAGQREEAADHDALGYGLSSVDIEHNGRYPGGYDNLALNLARLVLGA